MITIYHNPRCRKSRETLALLEAKSDAIEIIKYLETPPSEASLKEIIQKLGITPMELVRKNEAIWKENFKGNDYSDAQLIKILAAHPKLIERPIVIKGDQAVIGRPPSSIENLF